MRARMAALAVLLAVVATPLAGQGPDHGSREAGHEAGHAPAPTEGFRAELIQDVEQLESKFLGLARALSGSYGWRPGEGVRSVGEVFGHVAGANFMIPAMAGARLPEDLAEDGMQYARELERSGDEARITDALEHSFRHVRHVIAEFSDAELEETTEMFGRQATKRQVLTLTVSHMHEHLGQAIAYARVNGVTPPWSAGQ